MPVTETKTRQYIDCPKCGDRLYLYDGESHCYVCGSHSRVKHQVAKEMTREEFDQALDERRAKTGRKSVSGLMKIDGEVVHIECTG